MTVQHIVDAYTEAWTSGDVVKARSFLADDLDFQGSIDTFTSAEEFVRVLSGFVTMLKGVNVLQRYYSDTGAAFLYDCITDTPAGIIRTAEYFTVKDGEITQIRLVFDATELRKLMSQ